MSREFKKGIPASACKQKGSRSKCLLPHNLGGADKGEGLGGWRREDEEDEKKEAEEKSNRREQLAGSLRYGFL